MDSRGVFAVERRFDISSGPTAPFNPMVDPPPADLIPVGFVRRLRDNIEARITSQNQLQTQTQRQGDAIHIDRALNNMQTLMQLNQTYAGRLLVASAIGLFHLNPTLSRFIVDHDNLWKVVLRAQRTARLADEYSSIDALARVSSRIINVRNKISCKLITSTLNWATVCDMRASSDYTGYIVDTMGLLENEFIRILTEWDNVPATQLDLHELENVGPDHDIDDLGQDLIDEHPEDRNTSPTENSLAASDSNGEPTPISSAFPSPVPSPASPTVPKDTVTTTPVDDYGHYQLCCICFEPYSDTHQAFILGPCSHVVGKLCLSNWVNSTTGNANLCPQCRAPLCTRRPRRALPIVPTLEKPTMSASWTRSILQERLHCATELYVELGNVFGSLWGPGSQDKFFDECMRYLNERFFLGDMRFSVVLDQTSAVQWRLQRANWHS
ncbi:hypothetical protein N0V90_002831 [Kalmusia sp. IMI 367209]|nr:hypothetical protein N0V90_002831 [Kalmusia sp. IMI 367209]